MKLLGECLEAGFGLKSIRLSVHVLCRPRSLLFLTEIRPEYSPPGFRGES